MNTKKLPLVTAILLAATAMAGYAFTPAPTGGQSSVAERGAPDLDCKLTFSMTGWSLIYKHADGVGRVTCENGQSMPVKISIKGGGLTAGKWHVDNGKGKFTDVHTIRDVLGHYAQGGAHAGMVKSAEAQVLTKGNVSLALAGHGEGIDLGIDVGAFTISRR
ncbi:MAG TPA: hypothetical protein VJ823_04735 [Rhodanobacteraceae bacterium]|nr:hypothetical protein [Rhodanobacteraceae bacterium]